MKDPKTRGTIILLLFFGLVLGLGLNRAQGQPQDEPPAKPFPHNHPPYREHCYQMEGMGPIKRIISELELSTEQREKADRILAKNQAENKKLRENLRESREELRAIVSAPTFNESKFRKVFQQVSSIKEDLAVLRMKTLAELSEILTPEQQGYLRGRLVSRREFGRRCWPGPKEKGSLNAAGKPE